MKCYYHPEVEATATCSRCGRAICQTCAVNVGGKMLCQHCLASGPSAGGRAAGTTPTNSLAVVSIVLGVLGLLGCVCGGAIGGILFGVPAGITGWIARKQSQTKQDQQGLQLATFALVLGIAEVVLSVAMLVIFGSTYGCAFLAALLEDLSR